jgi:hypothetical protein
MAATRVIRELTATAISVAVGVVASVVIAVVATADCAVAAGSSL